MIDRNYKFKVGDKIKCVKNPIETIYTLNKIYTIKRITRELKAEEIYVINDTNHFDWSNSFWIRRNFKLVRKIDYITNKVKRLKILL